MPRASSKASARHDFAIKNIRRVEYGKIRQLFDIQTGPLTLISCRLVVDDRGKPMFVSPPQVKDGRTGKYICPVRVDREFLDEIFEAITSRLRADVEQAESWADAQDKAFERVVDEYEGGAQ